jgi:hypothetical protein
MGIDKSLNGDYPSIIIDGRRYHFGRELTYGEYLVENVINAKDYWCFKNKEDFLAFLVNLPESADRNRLKKLHPDWHEVTPEQRSAYMEESRAELRARMEDKQKAGTARHFPLYPDHDPGPFRDQEPLRIIEDQPGIQRVESKLREWNLSRSRLTEAGKLSVLEKLDWCGVSAEDKEAILRREVDFASITKDQFEWVYDDVEYETGLPADRSVGLKLFLEAIAASQEEQHEIIQGEPGQTASAQPRASGKEEREKRPTQDDIERSDQVYEPDQEGNDNVTKKLTEKNQNASIDPQQALPEAEKKVVTFNGLECRLEFHKYINGRTAIMLVDANNGEEVAMATVNVPEIPMDDNYVLIKDYSENAGMLQALQEAGIVKPTGCIFDVGCVGIPECELLVKPHQEVSQDISTPTQDDIERSEQGHEPDQDQDHEYERDR